MHSAWTFTIKETPAHSSFPVSSGEFLGRPFFQNTPEQVFLTLHPTNLNQENSWKLLFFLPYFIGEVKQRKKAEWL